MTSNPNIYAAGDCADAVHIVTDDKTWIPLALRANRAGWAVADNICGKNVELPGIAGTAVFKVFDLEVARTGLNLKEAGKAGFDPLGAVVKTRSRAHSHPGNASIHLSIVGDKQSGRLLGLQMVGKEGVAPPDQCPSSGPSFKNDSGCVCSVGYGVCTPVRAGLGSHVDGGKPVIEKAGIGCLLKNAETTTLGVCLNFNGLCFVKRPFRQT